MLGCDIIEIKRIETSITRFGEQFLRKILSQREFIRYEENGKRAEFVAGRFAAKEAVSKALSTGITGEIFFSDIEIMNDDLGRPIVYIGKELRNDILITISHSRDNAIAVAMIE